MTRSEESIRVPDDPKEPAGKSIPSVALLIATGGGGVVLGAALVLGYFAWQRPAGQPANPPGGPGVVARGTASITATPNPVPPGAEKFGKTTISWDTGDGAVGEVYVSINGGEEKRFSGAQAKGSQEAAWIGKGQHDFRLYAGKEHKTVLATVTVKRGP